MRKIKYKNSIALFVFALYFFVPAVTLADDQIGISFDNGLVSADIKNISLIKVMEYIENKSGMWFRGDEDLLNREVTAQFEKMPITEGSTESCFRLTMPRYIIKMMSWKAFS